MFVKRKSVPNTRVIPISGIGTSRNTMEEYVSDFIEGGISSGDNGFDTTVSEEDIVDMLANPDDNLQELSNLMNYYYNSNGDIYTLYTLFKALPDLKYKVGAFDSTIKRYELSISEITKALHKIRYKELTRDIIGQTNSSGGVVTMWCGNKKAPYLYVFENNDYAFAKYRVNGDWQCVIDVKWFDDMKEEEQLAMFTNLAPYVTESMYTAWKNDTENLEKRYINLPQDRTTYIRGDALKRNQRIGTPLGTQALLSISHKELLTNLEKSVSNRVMKNIGVLTIGTDEEGKSYVDISPTVRKQITSGVGKALKQNNNTNSNQIPIVSLPEFASLEFNKVDSLDALKPEKFETVNRNIATDTGVGSAFTNGMDGNYATAKINQEFLYKRIGMILEQIEVIFEKMFKLILPKNVADNFYFKFITEVPISTEMELGALTQLMTMGWSPKAVVDKLPSVNFDDFLEESIYFQELGIYDTITPPLSTYTATADDVSGEEGKKAENSDPTNENTVDSKTDNSNETPKPQM